MKECFGFCCTMLRSGESGSVERNLWNAANEHSVYSSDPRKKKTYLDWLIQYSYGYWAWLKTLFPLVFHILRRTEQNRGPHILPLRFWHQFPLNNLAVLTFPHLTLLSPNQTLRDNMWNTLFNHSNLSTQIRNSGSRLGANSHTALNMVVHRTNTHFHIIDIHTYTSSHNYTWFL